MAKSLNNHLLVIKLEWKNEMKQIEITVKLEENEKNAFSKLEKKGFERIRESHIDDIYLTAKLDKLTMENIQYILKKSVLLRKLTINGNEIKKITYKNKEIDKNGDVLSEQKINILCDDLNNAEKLFRALDFEELVEVKYHVVVYKKDDIEFAFQNVENLGILIEFENTEDFEGKTEEEIHKEKIKMHNLMENYGLKISKDYDVKKAYELIMLKLKNEE